MKKGKELLAESGKKTKGFFNDFKKFISRGNVIDLATGVIVGSAFTAITTAFTQSIFMPCINALFANVSKSSELVTILNGQERFLADGSINPECIYINWSAFINAVIDFILIAFVVFVFVRFINKLSDGFNKFDSKKKKEELEAAKAKEEQARIEKEENDKKKATEKTTNELLVELINKIK